MNNLLLLFITLTLTFPTVTFIATNNWITSAIVLVMTGVYLFLYAYPKVNKMLERNKKFHSCYTFINSFIIALSVKGSLISAFETTNGVMDQEYMTVIDGISNLAEEERLDYLKRHYDFDIYMLFLSVIKIYMEQGGGILSISYYLTEELRRDEDYLIKCESISKRKVIEFSMLWLFTLLIVLILRFALNSFYLKITNLLLFQVAIGLLFLLIIGSIHLFIVKTNKVEVRGYRNV